MAKPHRWNEMSEGERLFDARRLFETPRGKWLVGTAMRMAMDALRADGKTPMLSESDRDDLEMMQALFPPIWRPE